MSCVPGCPTCAPAKPTCAASSTPSTPSPPTATPTSNSPTTWKDSSPSSATTPTPPPSRTASACCGCSSRTSSSAPTRSPSATASRSATTPTPATRPDADPPRRVTIARVIHCVGGVLSPLLANIALSVLDEHVAQAWAAAAPPCSAIGGAKGAGHLPAGPLRGRLCGHGGRHQGHAEALRERGRSGAGPDGSAPVGSEDEDLPHRRGLRLPRLPHPAAPQARHGQALRLHLPVQEGLPRSRRRCER